MPAWSYSGLGGGHGSLRSGMISRSEDDMLPKNYLTWHFNHNTMTIVNYNHVVLDTIKDFCENEDLETSRVSFNNLHIKGVGKVEYEIINEMYTTLTKD